MMQIFKMNKHPSCIFYSNSRAHKYMWKKYDFVTTSDLSFSFFYIHVCSCELHIYSTTMIIEY